MQIVPNPARTWQYLKLGNGRNNNGKVIVKSLYECAKQCVQLIMEFATQKEVN
jgi:hypothetical protein